MGEVGGWMEVCVLGGGVSVCGEGGGGGWGEGDDEGWEGKKEKKTQKKKKKKKKRRPKLKERLTSLCWLKNQYWHTSIFFNILVPSRGEKKATRICTLKFEGFSEKTQMIHVKHFTGCLGDTARIKRTEWGRGRWRGGGKGVGVGGGNN